MKNQNVPLSTPLYMLQDANYNVVALTDAAGNLREQYAWEPYGTLSHVGTISSNRPDNRVGHQGLFYYRFDSTGSGVSPFAPNIKGLYYNRNRWYEPTIARFTTPDPNASGAILSPSSDQMGHYSASYFAMFDPEEHYTDGLNLYAYQKSNPIQGADPSGLFAYADTLTANTLGAQMDSSGVDVAVDMLRQFKGVVGLLNMRNSVVGSYASLASANTNGIDMAIGLYENNQLLQNAALGAGIAKVGAAFCKEGLKGIIGLATRRGHHVIPKWSGGNSKQLLYRGMSWADHRELERRIRQRMKQRFGMNIGGWWGGTGKWREAFEKDPSMQGDVYGELMDVYREWDNSHNTALVSSFIDNIMAGAFTQY